VLDGLAHGLVEPGAPRPAEVLVEGVLDQRVREGVAPRCVGEFVHDRGALDLVEQVDELVLVDLGRLCQELDAEVCSATSSPTPRPPAICLYPAPDK
jgi:hypothetical protein